MSSPASGWGANQLNDVRHHAHVPYPLGPAQIGDDTDSKDGSLKQKSRRTDGTPTI